MNDLRDDIVTHLSPEAVAGYIDRDLPRQEREQVELHLATCAECRAELAELRRLQRRPFRRGWVLMAAPAVAAAALVVAIAVPTRKRAPSHIHSSATVERQILIEAGARSPQTCAATDSLVWRSAGPGAIYTITLQAADGRLIWSNVVGDTALVMPDSIRLAPGTTFYCSVEAILPNGRSRATVAGQIKRPP